MDLLNLLKPYIIEYIRLKMPDNKIKKVGKTILLTCPVCKSEGCSLPPNLYKLYCSKCKGNLGNIVDIVRVIEPDKKERSEEEILGYLAEIFNVENNTDTEVSRLIALYKKYGFDLVPVAKRSKAPIEKSWTSREHKDEKEWRGWLKQKINLGVKTGRCSNITVLDFDTHEVSKEVLLLLGNTLVQGTNHGMHYFYKYEKDLPKTRIKDLEMDIENDGAQVVIEPSIVDGVRRKFKESPIVTMSEDLKKFLKSKISFSSLEVSSKKLKEDIKTEDFNLSLISRGHRNNFLLHLGGIFRKQMNIGQVDYILKVVNRHFCNPPLNLREIDYMIKSLDHYISFNEKELAIKILQYLKIVEEANSRDIKEALGEFGAEGKQRIEKSIKYLIREGYVYKKKREFHLIKRAEWHDTFIDEGKLIDFRMPYLDDYVVFRDSDLIIIGGSPKTGKTILSMNIIKRLVQQGKIPRYVSLESGSRFINHAIDLGLKEGDFKWTISFSPEDIEIEPNEITIIDWVLPKEYASTDQLFKHFAEQLVKNKGILIIFVQLKENGGYFAPNMIPQFPSVLCRYLYDDELGINGYFMLDYIRESRINARKVKIPCVYNRETKEVLTLNEVQGGKL